MALGRLPKRVQEPKPYEAPPVPDVSAESSTDREESGKDDKKPEPPPLTGVKLECAKLRAVLNANVGACHVKLVSSLTRLSLLTLFTLLNRKNTKKQLKLVRKVCTFIFYFGQDIDALR